MSIVTEVFPVKTTFFEKWMHRTGFELLRKNTSSDGKIDDVGYGRN
jgi:hypothetical protein